MWAVKGKRQVFRGRATEGTYLDKEAREGYCEEVTLLSLPSCPGSLRKLTGGRFNGGTPVNLLSSAMAARGRGKMEVQVQKFTCR
jgi:hypothetical protein